MQIADVKKYPKSYKKFLDYNRKYLLALTKLSLIAREEEVPEGLSELLTDSSVEIAAEGLLTYYPRALYDFFDENKLYAIVGHHHKDRWVYTVWGEAVTTGNGGYDSRITAEEAVFNEAFDLLEAHL